MSRQPVDAEAIRLLAAILTETSLTEIEISEGDSRIRVARAPAPMVAAAYAPAGAAVAGPGPGAIASPAGAGVSAGLPDYADHPGAVTSPMVGVAYLTAEPGAPAFVTEGQTVTAGQTLMLIEAMKTFNQIKAPKAGTLIRILVAAGAPVEFGEVLAVVE